MNPGATYLLCPLPAAVSFNFYIFLLQLISSFLFFFSSLLFSSAGLSHGSLFVFRLFKLGCK